MARNSGVYYYSEVDLDEVVMVHNMGSVKNPKMKSSDSSKNITFKVLNNTISGKSTSTVCNHSYHSSISPPFVKEGTRQLSVLLIGARDGW